jgi:hypothetical protein
MFGRIIDSGSKKVTLRRQEISGAYFAAVSIPAGKTAPRHIRKAAKLLCRQGVSRVLVPAGFSHWPLLRGCGLAPVDVVPFLQAMAPELTLAALVRAGVAPDQATVALAGARTSRALRDAALALCPVLRRLEIEAPSGGEELASFLRWEYGLAVLERGPAPRLTVAFSEPVPETGAPVLRLYEPADLLGLSFRLKTGFVPADAETISFLAALWELGRIGPGDVEAFHGEDT